MFKSLFGKNKEYDGVEKGEFHEEFQQDDYSEECEENEEEYEEYQETYEEYQERQPIVVRKALMRIIDTQIVYNKRHGVCYTMATCINEHNRIETINIEDCIIDSNVTNMIGAQIEYKGYTEYEPLNENSRIFL